MSFEELPLPAMACIAMYLQEEVDKDLEKLVWARVRLPALTALRQVSRATKAAVDACVQLVSYSVESKSTVGAMMRRASRDNLCSNIRQKRLKAAADEQKLEVLERAFRADVARWPCLSRVLLHCAWPNKPLNRSLAMLADACPSLSELSLTRWPRDHHERHKPAVLPSLAHLHSLRSLRLVDIPVEPKCLAKLAQLPSLEALHFHSARECESSCDDSDSDNGINHGINSETFDCPVMPRLKKLHVIVGSDCTQSLRASLENLPQWASLETLHLKGVSLRTTALELPPRMASLKLKSTGVLSIALSNPGALRHLSVRDETSLDELPDLSGATGLRTLHLEELYVGEVPGLENCKALTQLKVNGACNVDEWPDLGDLPCLQSLCMYDTGEMPSLVGCTSLREIEIDSSDAISVEAFQGLPSLTKLELIDLPEAHVTVHWGDAKGGQLTVVGDETVYTPVQTERMWRWFFGVLRDARPIKAVDGVVVPEGEERVPRPNLESSCDGSDSYCEDGDDYDDDEDEDDDGDEEEDDEDEEEMGEDDEDDEDDENDEEEDEDDDDDGDGDGDEESDKSEFGRVVVITDESEEDEDDCEDDDGDEDEWTEVGESDEDEDED